jgi:hypothetical protein
LCYDSHIKELDEEVSKMSSNKLGTKKSANRRIITYYVSEQLNKELREHCAERGMGLSEFLTYLVRREFDKS